MKSILITVFTIMVTGSLLYSQSAEEAVNLLHDMHGFGARAQSMGNAFTGVADDYSAVYWNPAGLAQLNYGEFYGSLYNYDFETQATYLNNTTTEHQAFTKLGSFGIAYPFPTVQGSFVIALGYQKVKDLGSYPEYSGYNRSSNNLGFEIQNEFGDYGVLPFDREMQEQQIKSNDGHLSQYSFAMAIDLSPRFSGGVTLNVWTGDNEYNSNYSQDDVNAQNSYDILDENDNVIEQFFYNYYDVNQKISTDYSGWELKLGGLFHFNKNLRIGGAITLPMTLNLEEEWSIDDELSYDIVRNDGTYNFVESAELGSGNFDYNISIPFKFSGGLAYETSRFLLAASADYRDWTQMKYEKPENRDDTDYTDLLDQNRFFREDFRAALGYRVGGELKLMNERLQLRGGYRYEPSPLKDVDKNYDRVYYSAGLGYRVDAKTQVEVSYLTGNWKNELYHYYDWDAAPMETSEEYTTSKLTFGVRLFF